MNKKNAISAISEIEKLMQEGGRVNDPVKREIQSLIFKLRSVPEFLALNHEDLVRIDGWVDILFSTRKFEKWGGSEQVMQSIRGSCSSLRSSVERVWKNEISNDGA